MHKTNEPSTRKKIINKKKSQKSGASKSFKISNIPVKDQISPKENSPNSDNKISLEENKMIVNDIPSLNNNHLNNDTDTSKISEKDLTNVYINNWLFCCFWCSSRKENINKILFKEGSRIITQRLDILAMFNHFYVIEIMQKKLGIEVKGMDMSDKCKNSIHIYDMYNNYNAIKN